MNKKKPLIFITLLFFSGMLFLTLTAKKFYIASLPHVKARPLNKESFTLEKKSDLGNITYERTSLGLPKYLYNADAIYKISTIIKNGEQRYIAIKLSNVSIGSSNADYYQVLNGISNTDIIILEGYEKLEDGHEVYITK